MSADDTDDTSSPSVSLVTFPFSSRAALYAFMASFSESIPSFSTMLL